MKGSKNSINNRGEKTVRVCKKCGEVQKPTMVIIGGKRKMEFDCSCGVVDKVGAVIIDRTELPTD